MSFLEKLVAVQIWEIGMDTAASTTNNWITIPSAIGGDRWPMFGDLGGSFGAGVHEVRLFWSGRRMSLPTNNFVAGR